MHVKCYKTDPAVRYYFLIGVIYNNNNNNNTTNNNNNHNNNIHIYIYKHIIKRQCDVAKSMGLSKRGGWDIPESTF